MNAPRNPRNQGSSSILDNNHSAELDLTKVPRDPWDRREYLLSDAVTKMLACSTDYIHNRYKLREQLESICWFTENVLIDAVPGNIELLKRVSFFPWQEANHELCVALDQALMGFYRAAYDHQRRALELILAGAWFVSEQVGYEDAKKWMNSHNQTPNFSNTLDKLSSTSLYAKLKSKIDWVKDVKKFYHDLCDIVHVRGIQKGIRSFRSNMFKCGNLWIPDYSENTLCQILDSYTKTINYTALLLAMSNPVVLFGLPVDKKYGMNDPLGFFNENQAKCIRNFIPKKYLDYLITFAKQDPRVTGSIDHFNALPDITDHELQAQIDSFNNTR